MLIVKLRATREKNLFTVVSNRKYVDLQNADEKDYPVSKYPIDAVGMSSDFV